MNNAEVVILVLGMVGTPTVFGLIGSAVNLLRR